MYTSDSSTCQQYMGRRAFPFVQRFHYASVHRGLLAQGRSRGNDVLEALAEVDASAVEGGELLDRVRVRARVRDRDRVRFRVRARVRVRVKVRVGVRVRVHLVDAAQAELGVEDEAAPALEERGRAEAAGEACAGTQQP